MIDNMTICLIVIIIIVFVFLLADFRIFKNFIKREKDRNIGFTSQQVQDYIKTYSKDGISKEFIEEFLKDILKDSSSSDDSFEEVENES